MTPYKLTRIRVSRWWNPYDGYWFWRIECPECGHDATVIGTVQHAFYRAEFMSDDHIPGGLRCAFSAAYALWADHPALVDGREVRA